MTCRYYGKCAKACDGRGLCVSFRNATYDCEVFEPMPDVDALLALADEMDRHADMAAGHVAYAARFDFAGWARRIREALGEVSE